MARPHAFPHEVSAFIYILICRQWCPCISNSCLQCYWTTTSADGVGEKVKDCKADCSCSFLSPYCLPKTCHPHEYRYAQYLIKWTRCSQIVRLLFSVSIPEGETDVEVHYRCLNPRVFAPEFNATGKVMEKTDVFDFGQFLLELLTGEILIKYPDWQLMKILL